MKGYKERYESFPYQRKALKKALKNGNAAFLFDPGKGKTKPTIDFYCIKFLEREVGLVLIVCPVSALGVWEDEIAKHCTVPYMVIRPDKGKYIEMSPDEFGSVLKFLIMTYDTVKTRVPQIKKIKPDGIVCDESQYIAHHSSKRSRALHRLGDMIEKNKIIMSGTAITKSPLNIYSQYRFLDKSVFGTRWRSFLDRYAVMGGYMGYKVVGIKRPKELAKKIRTLAVRAKKKEGEGPKKTFQIIPFDLSPKSRRIYDKMKKEAVVEFKSGKVSTAEIGAVKLMRFQQITGGFLKDEDGNYINIGDDKIRILDDLLESLEGHKVVIFARFKRDIRNIRSLCKRRGLKPLVIKGGVSGKKRDIRIKKFKEDDSRKVIIFQVAAGTAVDLTVSHIAIFYSMDYRPEHFIQCQDRIHRTNQTKGCIYYLLMARNTVDYSVYEVVKNNMRVSDLILDRYDEIIGGTLKL